MTTDTEPSSALAEPRRPVGNGWIGGLTAAMLGLYLALFTPIQVLLPLQLADIDPDNKVAAFGLVSGVGALVAVVVNPLAGALSDRTTSRFGRRHPWTLAGVVVAAIALAVLGTRTTVVGVLIGWCVAQAALNVGYAGLSAAVPDHVPVAQRGKVSGWIGFPQALGLVVGALLVTLWFTGTVSGYLALGVATVVLVLPFVLATADPVLPRAARPALSVRRVTAGLWVDPRRNPDFGWAWLTRFLVMLGNAMGTLYLLYFLQDAVGYEQLFPGHAADEGVLILTLVYTGGVIATAVAGGMLSDRLRRRRAPVAVASIVMALAALLLAGWHTWPMSIVAAAVMGSGFGVYLSVDQALITEVLPRAADRAKDLGVINIANSAPQVLGPALAAPIVAGLGGYPVLYLLTAVVTLAGGVLVWRIRSVR